MAVALPYSPNISIIPSYSHGYCNLHTQLNMAFISVLRGAHRQEINIMYFLSSSFTTQRDRGKTEAMRAKCTTIDIKFLLVGLLVDSIDGIMGQHIWTYKSQILLL